MSNNIKHAGSLGKRGAIRPSSFEELKTWYAKCATPPGKEAAPKQIKDAWDRGEVWNWSMRQDCWVRVC